MNDALNLVNETPAGGMAPGVLLVGPLMGAQVTAAALARWGLEVTAAADRDAALECLREMSIHAVVLDAGDLGGEQDLLAEIKAAAPHVEVVLLASVDTVDAALDGVRRGAFDFLVGQGSLALAIKVREALAAARSRSTAGSMF